MTWRRQKELDQGNSAPDKPLGDTLEPNSAHRSEKDVRD